jgi:hypothetical protein
VTGAAGIKMGSPNESIFEIAPCWQRENASKLRFTVSRRQRDRVCLAFAAYTDYTDWSFFSVSFGQASAVVKILLLGLTSLHSMQSL